jgi:hypothetical protein
LGDGYLVAPREYAALHLPLPRRHGQAVLHGPALLGIIVLLQRKLLLLNKRWWRLLLQKQLVCWGGEKEHAFLLPPKQPQDFERTSCSPVR